MEETAKQIEQNMDLNKMACYQMACEFIDGAGLCNIDYQLGEFLYSVLFENKLDKLKEDE